ncbi:hypothetical protein ACWGDS_23595 [Streptomyces sp. NPDC055059]|uniref:hypothetical protein n=1 Tax=Streptomyces sp. NPDC127172 TaxID=3345382 RepID=UPI003644DCE5
MRWTKAAVSKASLGSRSLSVDLHDRGEPGAPALDLAHTTFAKWTGAPGLRPAEGARVLLRLRPEHIHRKD